jgi:hypothetical protein
MFGPAVLKKATDFASMDADMSSWLPCLVGRSLQPRFAGRDGLAHWT